MADERIESLRESARHRGLTLKVSRRRKAGGDFGKMGLVDAHGNAVMGSGEDGLTASVEELETYLRTLGRADWTTSAGTVRRQAAPARTITKSVLEGSVEAKTEAAKPEPPVMKPKRKSRAVAKPETKPRGRVVVENLFANLPAARQAEAFLTLFEGPGVRVERIVSRGQVTPKDAPMIQPSREWVVLLSGEARLRIADADEVTLKPGDHVTIEPGQPHWVTYTSSQEAAVWLAVHVDDAQ